MITHEKIKSISEYWDEEWEGYKIITTHQCIDFRITNEPYCCERWGHLSSDDNFNEYINCELLDIVLVDQKRDLHPVILENLKPHLVKSEEEVDNTDRYVLINVITNAGTLQFAIYNDHNGYYGHEVEIKSQQLSKKTTI